MLDDKERIIKYTSTVQNSGVPYGYTLRLYRNRHTLHWNQKQQLRKIAHR